MDLTKDAIFSADDLPRIEVKVPEWGGSVYVQAIGADRRDELDNALDAHRDKDGKLKSLAQYRALLAVFTVCDKDGRLLFAVEDAAKLVKKSARALERVAAVANRLNGISPGEIDEMIKNCDGDPG